MGDGGAHESHPYSITISLLRVLNNPKYELFQKVFPFTQARVTHYINIYIVLERWWCGVRYYKNSGFFSKLLK